MSSGDRKTFLQEVMEHARGGDAFSDVIDRYIDAEERRKLRSAHYLDHLLLRLDLSRFPLPVTVRAGRDPCLGYVRIHVGVLSRGEEHSTSFDVGEDLLQKAALGDEGWEEEILRRVVMEAELVWWMVFKRGVRVRTREEADDLLKRREDERLVGKVTESVVAEMREDVLREATVEDLIRGSFPEEER